MKIQFDPKNNIIKLCMSGMSMEENGQPEDAGVLFLEAWSKATDDFERFIAAYYVALLSWDKSRSAGWGSADCRRGFELQT